MKIQKIPPDAERAVREYGNSILRLCTVMTGNRDDADDALQECFLRYMEKAPDFNDTEHEKAWIIRVATNICKDILRQRKRRSFISLDEIRNLGTTEDNAQILGMLVSPEEKHRIIIHLHYVEGYKINEISSLLGITESAAKKRLQRGRDALRKIYEKEAE